jgi:tRNA (cmo5U34)-methyltransferase
MNRDEIAALFDQQAAGYDAQWERMSPVREGLYFLVEAAFATLPADARVLSVGSGTGIELEFLAARFPQWQFTAVEPSQAMLERCRDRAVRSGFASRCTFHHGFLESLERDAPYDAATCLLVSQFLVDPTARRGLFRDIAIRMRPGGVLVNADLAADVASSAYEPLLAIWLDRMSSAGVPPEAISRARAAYAKDVAVLPPAQVAALIASAGFEEPTPFFQAGLMHAWCATRAVHEVA